MDQEVGSSENLSEQVVWQQGKQESKETDGQLVVPEKYRESVMELAQDISVAGQLRINRTRSQFVLDSFCPRLAQGHLLCLGRK